MPGMPGGRERLEPEGGLADDVDVLFRHRRELAPEVVERVAVEAAGAVLQLRRVDEVRGADLGDVDLQLRVLPDEEPAAPAWSRWMWLRQMAQGLRGSAPRSWSPRSSAGMQLVGPQSKRARPSSVSTR